MMSLLALLLSCAIDMDSAADSSGHGWAECEEAEAALASAYADCSMDFPDDIISCEYPQTSCWGVTLYACYAKRLRYDCTYPSGQVAVDMEANAGVCPY